MHQSPKVKALVPLLLRWFSQNARDLPWRRTSDPYAVWVSEIMLQQTQVKTVIPYWNRWMKELPTIQSLARASEAKIHKLWEGLGYYTRVRNMPKAAQSIDVFPRHFDDVLALPGIGRYTAGAICSIAFNQPTPILDGNVIRVLTRIFGIGENPKEKITNGKLWDLAGQLVGSTTNCSHLNQSLMELGALICTPRSPNCSTCPVAKHCVALKQGRIEELPNLGPRTVATARRFAAFVVEKNGRWLVRQRPAGVVNAHLWEFPNVEVNGSDIQTLARDFLGVTPASLDLFCTVRHSITRYRITLEAFQVDHKKIAPPADSRWLTTDELQSLAFASAHKKILTQLNRRASEQKQSAG
jgi:A/G-specific adenine glycosylase